MVLKCAFKLWIGQFCNLIFKFRKTTQFQKYPCIIYLFKISIFICIILVFIITTHMLVFIITTLFRELLLVFRNILRLKHANKNFKNFQFCFCKSSEKCYKISHPYYRFDVPMLKSWLTLFLRYERIIFNYR